ncbi:helix-turn-helix transcriptional regulator, partial [Eubacterium ventriosum]|uniref:helix-turn-helix transcriptional regulator n=1 Tax=Eubacterium ventriosum TaxID=39496 RepID=UPI0034665D9E
MCYILEIKEMFGMDSNKTPSEIIAELCVEAGISKSELARRLEITPSQIRRILNGD